MNAALPQAGRAQSTGVKSAGIEIEPETADFGLPDGRMAVHDQLRQRLRAVIETRADVDQVVVLLIGDRAIGIDAGMDEQGLRRIEQNRQPAQEIDVIVRKPGSDECVELSGVGILLLQRGDIHAIGSKRRVAAERRPIVQRYLAIDIGEHGHFVIAGQANAIETLRRPRHETADDLCGSRAAIDVVSQHDNEFSAGKPCGIGDDLALQRAQEIVAAMHVADDISGHIEMLEPLAKPTMAETLSHLLVYPDCRHKIPFRAYIPKCLNDLCKRTQKRRFFAERRKSTLVTGAAIGQTL
ncbi:hypothetical protein RHSP_22962 [Rhizobium freirei PRF 81]|uniref:Uncharacterized protein n=1 Tax=Rhizobium freirei PRF 81 TaxID=363754 RepID=N6URR2_9HYPH|nr:hypothetical protein RHSP_22962 [Rhizobium freirei PRF 81]